MRRRVASWLVLGLGLALAAVTLLPAAFGCRRYVIEGGSMGDALPRGSIAYERDVPVAHLRVGDVITYSPPAHASAASKVTHRIVWIGRDTSGRRAFQTKGDANHSRDPWRFTLRSNVQPRVEAHLPVVGYPLAALQLRTVRLLAIGIPALVIAAMALWGELGGVRPRRARRRPA